MASTSPQSASSNWIPSGRSWRSPPIMLSQPTTACPRWMNATERSLPRNPATPETKTFMYFFSLGDSNSGCSESSSPPQHGGYRSEQDAHVQPEGPLLNILPVSYTHLRAHETRHDLVCRLLLEKKK